MKCIILAGGSGERLWPISRDLYPKSLLKLDGEKTLVQNVYEIAASITSEKNIIVVTNIRQACDVKIQLKQVAKNPLIISEPLIKNTAPAIASALTFIEGDKDETIIVLPVDFNIDNKELFIKTLKKTISVANKGNICALGIKPAYLEGGFGYIKKGDKINNAYKVEKFIEKPDDESVNKFVDNKDYYWNSGIYTGKISVFKENFKRYLPEVINCFSKNMFDENCNIKYEYYKNLPEISIDYAIMEKTNDLVFIEYESKWYDLGSWQSIYNKEKKDAQNNVISGNVITDKVKDSFIYSSKELLAVSGVKNKVVIETEDAILVCSKNKASDINKLVKALKKNNDSTTVISKTVYKPWGYYTCLNEGKGWLTKLIYVSPKNKLSLQSHNHRSEHWVVLEGEADVVLNEDIYNLKKGKSIDIPLKVKHSLQNNTNEPLKILEVQKGDYISEDDIIRYEDMYGRAN